MSEQMTVNGMLILCAGIVVFWIAAILAIRVHGARHRTTEVRRGRNP